MEVEDVRKAKAELEGLILERLQRFERRTDLAVTEVDLIVTNMIGLERSQVITVQLKVEL